MIVSDQLSAQSESGSNFNSGVLRADFQFDAQSYTKDSIIDAPEVPQKVRSQGYLNLLYTRENFSAGLRYEGYFPPLLGIDARFEGSGIPYRFIRYQTEDIDVTLGNFYEQFGTGTVLRTYVEPTLGFDNSIDGIRIKSSPLRGVSLTGIYGKQRSFFSLGPGIVRGADVEISLNDLDFGNGNTTFNNDVRCKIGASVVSRFQTSNDPIFNLPQNVLAYSLRANFASGDFHIDGEWSYKYNDPSFSNKNSFNPGTSLFISTSYSSNGFGLTLNAKRIDNFDFRSDRNQSLNVLNLNFLPPVTKQHTYRLITLYPYATQPNGEIGFQAELVYSFPKGSFFGGQYGTTITLNYSNVHSLDTVHKDEFTYESTFFGIGSKRYFDDFNIEINKIWSKKIKTNLSFIMLSYNKAVIEGLPGSPMLYPISIIADMTYQINPTNAIRFEFQHMGVNRDKKNWVYGLIEYTMSPGWYFTAYNEFNYGNDDPAQRVHYWGSQVAYVKNSTRVSFGYAIQRAGILCVGGVCRLVPAANGFGLSISSSF